MSIKDYKITENAQQITFILKNKKLNSAGVIAIQKIPQVNLRTAKITGYRYSVKSSKKYNKWRRFNKKSLALKYAKSLME